MYITRKALEQAGIEVHLNEDGLSIAGQEPVTMKLIRALKQITDELEYSPDEADRLTQHVTDVPLLRKLTQIRSI